MKFQVPAHSWFTRFDGALRHVASPAEPSLQCRVYLLDQPLILKQLPCQYSKHQCDHHPDVHRNLVVVLANIVKPQLLICRGSWLVA